MVPKGWTLLQVSDICKLQNGNSFKPHEWDTQGLPIIRIQNLNGSDNYNYFSGVPQDKWLVEPGQLLFSWAGTKGVSFGPFIWNGPKGVLNQHIYKVFANENVHGHWLYLALLHITQKIEAQAHGFKSTLLHVQKKDIDNQFVLTPPVAEQKKIAQILSTWDKAISVTESLLANSQQQKKALMQQLLTGKKRLLDENGERFSGEWRNSTLSMFCNIAKGKALSASDLEVGDFPVIAGGKSSPYSHSDYTHENVVTVSASGAYAGYISYHNYKIWASDCSVVSAKADNLIDYFYQLLLSLQDKIYSLQSGGAQPHIYPKDLNSIPLWVPCVKEQQKIAAVLSAADVEISTLEKKLACLKDEKKALMQQLLTGKRRVKVDEAVAA
ncbi:restriction endonuclease subunit S [Escherichia coli]|nr:restriction endonuclease subunit S [Escherichia coli]EJE7652176.1 restriction endonuclease subunit S [Escherichia coli]HCT3942518.1 restriction endonuclease subunit S [Escherichia coli]